jgi:hypothetical protein
VLRQLAYVPQAHQIACEMRGRLRRRVHSIILCPF